MGNRKPTLMQIANAEAIRCGNIAVGPEHNLIALASQPTSLASRVLASRGVGPRPLPAAVLLLLLGVVVRRWERWFRCPAFGKSRTH
jgi:hypothetical protein